MRRFILTTTYNDYEEHGDTPLRRRTRIKVYADNYREAVINANKWIKQHSNQYNGYSYIPIPKLEMQPKPEIKRIQCNHFWASLNGKPIGVGKQGIIFPEREYSDKVVCKYCGAKISIGDIDVQSQCKRQDGGHSWYRIRLPNGNIIDACKYCGMESQG